MLTKPVVQDFIAQAQKRSFAPKTTLVRAGEVPSSLLLILEGSVSVVMEDEQGREIVLSYLGPGSFLGESGLFPDPRAKTVTVRTRQATLVAAMSYPAFTHFSQLKPDIMFEIAGQLAMRLRDTSIRLRDLAFMDVAARITHALLTISQQPGARQQADGRAVTISRMELARNVACSREMAGRALKKLEQEGVVRLSGRQILVLDPPRAA